MLGKHFKNKVIVVTGASAGLGRSIVREFAKHKAKIALLARGIEGLEAAKKEVEVMGGHALAIPTDVSDAEQVESAASKIEEMLGPINVWINNAMVSVFSPFKEMTAEEFKQVTDVTYLGQVYGTLAALKRMIPRNRGKIILVGSALAYRGIPLQSAYCGAKHGIHGFFESLRCELLHDKSNIGLCMVQLPAMNTTQFDFVKSRLPNRAMPMGKIYDPEIAARAVVYAAAGHRREIFVGSSTVKAIWGNKFIPEYLDYYLAKTGYSGQQTTEPEDPERKNNLWQPIPGDHGVHGLFSNQSKSFSTEYWATSHKILVGAMVVTAACFGFALGKKIAG